MAGKGGGKSGNGLTLEITDGITEHANRVALKGVFCAFGDVLACWVPPIDRRGVDHASVRFAAGESAECAKQACDAGQVFFQGLPLKCKWRAGGGPRVGNSDIGGCVGGNSPTRAALGDRDSAGGGGRRSRDRGDRRGERDRDRRRSRSRRRRSRSRGKEVNFQEGGTEDFNPAALMPPEMSMPPPQFQMPPEMMMQMQQPPMGMPGGMPAMQQQALPEPVRMPTAEEIEAEARRKAEVMEKRKAQLKRGPGVAALVQGALKSAQVASAKNEAEKRQRESEEMLAMAEARAAKKAKEDAERPKKSAAQLAEERYLKEEEEKKERQRFEREAIEREKEKAKQAALEREREEARLIEDAATRENRVRAGVEAAKKQQVMRERQVSGGKLVMGPENLYGDMPIPGVEPQDDEAEKRRKDEARRAQKNFNLPAEDLSKVVFLDIDGVLRPARAGGFDIVSEGKEATQPDTSDFFPSAMKALRHIIERTGACLVLSSEWRRSEALRDAIDEVLEAHRIRPHYCFTAVDVDEVRMSDPVRSFADRRAREVTAWLRQHEDSIKGWVVLDDINLAIVDEEKKATTKSMAPKLVQTWPLCGLTMGNAKTAVRILNGEMIHKVLVERPKAPGGINMGGGTAV